MHESKRRVSVRAAFLLSCGLLAGCGSLLTEGTSTGAGIAGAGIAGAITHNAAIATGIGLGVQAGANAGLQYAERRVHRAEQDTIAAAAGVLKEGDVGGWSITHDVPIEEDEHGAVMVSRSFGSGDFRCKEIVFSVDPQKPSLFRIGEPGPRAFYMANICQDGAHWRWASAEPSVDRWISLQ